MSECGVGLVLTARVSGDGGGGVYVDHVKKGGPAWGDGRIRIGDRIISVGGCTVRDVDVCATMVMGQGGTPVTLQCMRGSENFAITLLRERAAADPGHHAAEARNAELEQQIVQLQNANRALEERVSEADKALQEANGALNESVSEVVNLTHDLTLLQDANRALHESHAATEAPIKLLKQEMTALREVNAALKQGMPVLQEANAGLEDDALALRDSIQILTSHPRNMRGESVAVHASLLPS